MNIKICDVCKSKDKETREISLPDHVDGSQIIDRFDARCARRYPIKKTYDLCFDCFMSHVYNLIYDRITSPMNARQQVDYFDSIVKKLEKQRRL